MEPDTDTDSDDADIYDDEEYQTLMFGVGDAHSRAEVGEQLCEAYFQAKRRWRNCTGRHTRRRRFANRRRPGQRRVPSLL
eukprot:5226490-Prorocentrum_lima.AAC.1